MSKIFLLDCLLLLHTAARGKTLSGKSAIIDSCWKPNCGCFQVAIKTIKKSKIETEADLIRIRREIQIMSSVQHPNIIHIYEGHIS